MTVPLEFEVDDAVILLLGSAAGRREATGEVKGITRLEKLVFLLERETDAGKYLTESPAFEAYNFGPFSQKVYQAIDTLVSAGLVEDSAQLSQNNEDTWELNRVIGDDLTAPSYSTRNFRLTELGREYFDALRTELPSTVVNQVGELRKKFSGWPLRELVRYVYERYDSYTQKSLIRDEILGK